ncbi:hypothetical protein N7474_002738 [Penicillium riverlandense]|uniref:uncharacterized protein n=1 Tax=Penicillium riverlandense TaxID=1903569 RepID=UPI002548BC78|nr:uncharacterized protein N7474_002738 [Penicillium riverlandense]KAJ5825600.1 hypothetical protein N7474_002738 [Penicillium riverlandense]
MNIDIVQGRDLEFIPPPLKHRGDGLAFKNLFRGEDGTPENYYLALARQADFYSPRHKHNFDQFRYAVRNDVSIGPDMLLREGELCYHPEAVHYGPQKDEGGDRDVLVLQFGGASGQGYLSFDQLAAAQAALKEKGRFEGGRYYAENDGATSEGKDGYEALWEYFNHRPLVYAEPRFDKPIIVKPKGFAWKPCAGSGKGIFKKTLGVFTERETRVQIVKIVAGNEWLVRAQDATQLLYVLQGRGVASQPEAGGIPVTFDEESAIRLKRNSNAVALSADRDVEIMHFILPTLS